MTRNISQNAGSFLGEMEDVSFLPQNLPITFELILYDKLTIDFDTVGKAHLEDVAYKVRVHQKLNSDYTLDFSMPIGDERFDLINEGDYIKANGQLFIVRLVEKKRENSGVMTGSVECEHVYYKLIDKFIPSIKIYEKTPAQMLDAILAGTRFTYDVTEIVAIGDLQVTRRNGVQALERFINRFGAEIERDNFLIRFRDEIGQQKGTSVKYGRNQKSILKQVDGTNVITRLYLYGKDGLTIESITGDEIYIESENIDLYDEPREAEVEFNDIEDPSELLDAGIAYLAEHDTPRISYEVELLELKALAGYDPQFESMNLGDTIDVEDEEMGINIIARVVEYEEYLDMPEDSKIILSNFIPDVSDPISKGNDAADKIDGVVTDEGQISTERLQGQINVLRNQIIASGAYTSATVLPDQGMLFENINEASPDYGAMYIGPGIFAIANSKLPDGTWNFRSFGTGAGFTADEIIAGKMSFSLLEGGVALLGGTSNGNGRLVVYNEQNEVIADLSAESGGFDKLYVGDFQSPSVENVNRESYTVYVDANLGIDTNPGTSTEPMQSIQATLDKIPKQNYGDVIIEVVSDVYESLVIDGYVGSGSINFDFNNNEMQGSIKVVGCTNMILIDYVEINAPSGTVEVVRVERSSYAALRFSKVYGHAASARGIHITRGSSVFVGNSEFYNVSSTCIYVETNSAVMIQSCKGLANYGVASYTNSKVGISDTIPEGNINETVTGTAGVINGTATPDAGAATPPPAPQTTQQFFEVEANSYRDNFGGQWSGTSGSTGRDIIQGQWQEWGLYRGCWFFGSGLSTALTGKTIKQMRIKIKRQSSGGYSANTDIYVKPHTHATRPAGAPSFLSPQQIVKMGWGDERWVTLPTSFHSVFTSGSAKGLGIFINSTNNRNYARLSGDIILEVVYE